MKTAAVKPRPVPPRGLNAKLILLHFKAGNIKSDSQLNTIAAPFEMEQQNEEFQKDARTR